ncbi:hypothetical protein D3C71_1627470 [compost metagenome]
MAFDHVAPVLDATIPLDGGSNKAAEKAHDAGKCCQHSRFNRREGSKPVKPCAHKRGTGDPADQSLPGLGRRDAGSNLVTTEKLAEDILQHIAALHCRDQEGDQQQPPPFITRNGQGHQRRHMADAVDG